MKDNTDDTEVAALRRLFKQQRDWLWLIMEAAQRMDREGTKEGYGAIEQMAIDAINGREAVKR